MLISMEQETDCASEPAWMCFLIIEETICTNFSNLNGKSYVVKHNSVN